MTGATRNVVSDGQREIDCASSFVPSKAWRVRLYFFAIGFARLEIRSHAVSGSSPIFIR